MRKVPTPLTQVRAGIDATRSTLALGLVDALAPAAFERYFPLYYAGFASRDKRGIVDDLRNRDDFVMAFRTAADKFKLVDDEQQATVIVPYVGDGPDATDTAPLIARLRHGDTDRWLLRKLQRFTVTVRQNMVNVWQARGDVHELQPGLYLLIDELRYDQRYGLMPEGQMLSAMGLVA